MSTTPTPHVVFEVWSEDAAERASPSAPRPSAHGPRDPRRGPASPVALVLAALVGAALASGGFTAAAVLDDARDTAALPQQVTEAITDMVRNQELVLARLPVAPVPEVPSDPRAPCSPVRVDRLGHC